MSDSFAIDATGDSLSEHYTFSLTLHPVSRVANDNSARTKDDQATLSSTAKAKLWRQQGLSVAEIADQLGLSVSTIQEDLGIATTAAAASQTSVATA